MLMRILDFVAAKNLAYELEHGIGICTDPKDATMIAETILSLVAAVETDWAALKISEYVVLGSGVIDEAVVIPKVALPYVIHAEALETKLAQADAAVFASAWVGEINTPERWRLEAIERHHARHRAKSQEGETET